MALVSVIIPYYKKINQISKTLNSVLAQTFQDFEIILIYDDTDIHDLVYIKESFSKNSKIKIKRRLRSIMNDAIKTINMNLNYSYLFIAKKNLHDANYKMIKDSIFKDLSKVR